MWEYLANWKLNYLLVLFLKKKQSKARTIFLSNIKNPSDEPLAIPRYKTISDFSEISSFIFLFWKCSLHKECGCDSSNDFVELKKKSKMTKEQKRWKVCEKLKLKKLKQFWGFVLSKLSLSRQNLFLYIN